MHVLVHGGVGHARDDAGSAQHEVDRAAEAGVAAGDPDAAVLAAVRHLESTPGFNAGVGAAVQSDGRIRTDAGVTTATGRCGAACAMCGVEHAVDVAHAVAVETPHVLVAGDRAVTLAEAVGVATDRDLWTDATRQRWAEVDPPDPGEYRAHLDWVREHFGGTDTVGAVATDGSDLAAATATGGRWFALAGRVGDVPQVGAGFYATDEAAASATGAGEAIARYGLSRRVVRAVADGHDPQAAADGALRDFESATGGEAGLIVVDARGGRGVATTTGAMPTGVATSG